MEKLREVIQEITTWQNETFKDQNVHAAFNHLRKELKELEAEVFFGDAEPDNKLVAHELADCLFLLIRIAKECGFNYDDVVEAMVEKLKINKSRNWGKPSKDGIIEHI